jgi:hypothetical protein
VSRKTVARESCARAIICSALAEGEKTLDELRPGLKSLGNYGRTAGLELFLTRLEAAGEIVSRRYRPRPTASLETFYRLPG